MARSARRCPRLRSRPSRKSRERGACTMRRQGANSGAHISVITKSGTNAIHGELYEYFQNSAMNAAPFFYNASPAITVKNPFLARNQFGATLGGPIKKDKLFYFGSYQGVRIAERRGFHQGHHGAAGADQRPQPCGNRQRGRSQLRHDDRAEPDQPGGGRAFGGDPAGRPVPDPERRRSPMPHRRRRWATTRSSRGRTPPRPSIRRSAASTMWSTTTTA